MRSYAHRSEPSHLATWKRVLLVTFSIIFGLVLLVLLAGSPIAKAVINRKLAALPTYTGRVDTVKLQLWRGGAEIENFVLRERNHTDDVPVVQTKRASLALSWSALFRGKVGGKVHIDAPQVTITKREVTPPKSKEQKKEEKKEKAEIAKAEMSRWQDVLAQAFPMEISDFEIRDGVIRFIDRTRQPEVDLILEKMHVVASGLTNRPEAAQGPLPAKVEVDGVTTGNGKLKVTAQADPLAKQPRFTTSFELTQLELPAMNGFLLAYTDADVSRGVFELFTEVNAANGSYEGYIKPLFQDLDFKNPSDKDKNVAQRVKEKVVSAVASVLK